MDDAPDVAGVVAPPPAIFAGALAAGLAANRLVPMPMLPVVPARVLAVALAAGAGALGPPAFRRMRAAGTNVNPYRPSTAIVDGGPFRFSRNPLYVSMALLYAAIALWTRRALPLTLLPGVLVVVQRGVIAREERYLERTFGSAYLDYKARVRRWL